MKQRKFKSSENNTRYWNGKTNKFVSAMKNYDIEYAIASGDWSYLEKSAKNQMMWSKFNRENNLKSTSNYNKNSNSYNSVNFKSMYKKAVA